MTYLRVKGCSKILKIIQEVEHVFYSDIFDQLSKIGDLDKRIICICQEFIELMHILKETNDKNFITNALIVLLALFESEFYALNGNSLDNILYNDRDLFIAILKEEFV